MKFYYVNADDVIEFCAEPRYFKTLKEAKKAARAAAQEAERDIQVEEIEVGNKYDDVLTLLNYHSQNETIVGVPYMARYKDKFE